MSERASLCDAVRQMTDQDLRDAAYRIRGNPKRAPRAKLTEPEIEALSAIWREQGRRAEENLREIKGWDLARNLGRDG